jgi:UDP-GlcNAc:undecaprenyl-phosphate/decaprenyl-phosphate GlcNAc-1-phosphate transferase
VALMLHTLADHLQIVWGALLAAAIVVLLTPAVGGMARLLGVVDRPEGRRLNRSTVPRLGGLALFFGIFVPALAFLDLSRETRGLLLGAAVATTVGAVDDFRGLRWWEKLGGQVAAAAIPVGFGIWVHRFTFPIVGIHTLPKWLGMPVSVLWIVAIMNMVNFLDGLDGLAAGVSAISAFTFTLIALSLTRPEINAAILSAIVLGACLGFLRHNVYPARIFMGDSGALLLGFVLATIPLQGLLKTASVVTLFFPLLVLAVPILDTSFVVAKRLKYRQPVYAADRTHLHHRFVNIGFSQRRAATYIWLWCGTLAATALSLRFIKPHQHGDWHPWRTAIVGAIGLVALTASVYMVYLLEIVKLANPRIRRREAEAREAARKSA